MTLSTARRKCLEGNGFANAGNASRNFALLPCGAQSDIHVPSMQMELGWAEMAKIHELRASSGETEKITINPGYVDLGHIDLMVRRLLFEPDGLHTNGDPEPIGSPWRRAQKVRRETAT
jgi:hypothetical protein